MYIGRIISHRDWRSRSKVKTILTRLVIIYLTQTLQLSTKNALIWWLCNLVVKGVGLAIKKLSAEVLACMAICLERGANDLYVVQLMPLPCTSFSKTQNDLSFWYQLIQVVLQKRPLKECISVISLRLRHVNVGLHVYSLHLAKPLIWNFLKITVNKRSYRNFSDYIMFYGCITRLWWWRCHEMTED